MTERQTHEEFFDMSSSKSTPIYGTNKTGKRNLPSWMSSREKDSKPPGQKPADRGVNEDSYEGREPNEPNNGRTVSKETESPERPAPPSLDRKIFSKLLEGVVFVLSGFANPERGILRSKAVEMGAEYQPDWNSGCTLLICAFPNTPKFRQVAADCGTIISKEWIAECYTQKKLIDIDPYLMHAGKPWRRSNVSNESNKDKENSTFPKSQKQVKRKPPAKQSSRDSFEIQASGSPKDLFPLSEVKKWATEDLNRTITWLASQEEKPEPSEMRKIAAEGILTCLQDAIDSVEHNQDIHQTTEQWNIIPHVVNELAKLGNSGSSSAVPSSEDLYRQAVVLKQIYEAELGRLNDESFLKKNIKEDVEAYDSDETIEMTEEEIDLAYRAIASSICK